MAVKDDGEMRAEGEGGSLRGGVAQEQAARLPRAQPRASRQTAAAADIAYTKACSLVPSTNAFTFTLNVRYVDL